MADEKKEKTMNVYFPDVDATAEEKAMAVKVINNYLENADS